MKDKCQVPKCKNESTMSYLGKRICSKCWAKHCSSNKFDLKKICSNQSLKEFI